VESGKKKIGITVFVFFLLAFLCLRIRPLNLETGHEIIMEKRGFEEKF